MKPIEELYQKLREKNIRVTQQRRAIIDALDGKHLTLYDLHLAMKAKGYKNLGTIYNNLDFLMDQKIVTEVYIKGKKHYDLVVGEQGHHSADQHIHLSCSVNNKIVEIDDKDLFEMIKNHEIFKGFNISKMQIVVEGECPNYDPKTSKITSACHVAHLT
jgi:Fur family ferric uptake transcriptional regulator/Fur family peroxide stress response transcriptional regulator